MSQVSYGTITITDTNDIESITVEYNRNQSSSNAPSATDTNWSTTRPDWAQGYYIWQRTRVHKSGTTADKDVIGTAVCITGSTGSTGAPGRGLTDTTTQYCNYGTGEPADNYSGWTDAPPSYDSSKPNYWVMITNTYSAAPTSEIIKYKDEALTKAVSDAAIANSIATHANEDAQGAMAQATATQIAQEALSHSLRKIWINETTSGTYLAGTYAASGLTDGADSGFKTNDPSTYGFNSLLRHTYLSFRYNTHQLVTIGTGINTDSGGISGIAINSPIVNNSNQIIGVIKGLELTSTELKFYEPNTSGTQQVDAQLDANGLKLTKGGIEAGTPGQSGFVYLSTIDYPLKDDNASPNPIPGLTINGYTPAAQGTDGRAVNDSAWRMVIGDKFGVDSEGNLYASNANINGIIKVDGGSNVYNVDEFNETIYGVITYQYDNNGNIETVYKKNVNDTEVYYYIESDGTEQEVNKSNLEVDSETNELITTRINGLDTLIDNIAIKVDNTQDSISLLQNNTTEELNLLAQNDNIINERLSTQLSMQSQRLDKLEGYIIIDSSAGFIQVGEQNGNSYVKIDGIEAMVSINTNEKEKVAYISEDRFYAPSAVVTNLYMKTSDNEIGAIGWVMRSNGHLSLKRIK